MTRVEPTSMSTLPSAVGMKLGVSLTGRSWSGVRLLVRTGQNYGIGKQGGREAKKQKGQRDDSPQRRRDRREKH